MRRLRLAAALLLASALLAGCSQIPTTGTVRAGATQAPNGTTIVYVANPPVAGDSQQDIVTGFLAAMSAGGQFTVAKKYLSPSFAEKWQPRSQVLVQETQSKVVSSSTNAVSLSVPITARVDSHGVYRPRSTPEPLDFHLTQVNGQWRIDSAPNGIVLTPPVFQKFYQPYALQFFDPTWKRLVPDLRWFPVVSSTAGSLPSTRSIVQELIAGPAGPLSSGVTVNALDGATVQGIGPSASDVTTVTLTVPESDPTAELAARMQQQLIKSLRLPTPAALRLILNDRVAPQVSTLMNTAPSQVAYVVSGGRFGELPATGVFTPDGTLGKRIDAAHPRAVTVSMGQGLAAVLTASERVAIVSTTATRVVPRPVTIAPTLDQRGWIYFVPSDSPVGVAAVDAKGEVRDLFADLPGTSITSITSIEVSPDGTRMLVLVATTTGPEALVEGIIRSKDGAPTGLTSAYYPVDLGGNTGKGLGATWVDDSEVAVLVQAPDGSIDRVQLQQLGGTGSALGKIPSATSIVGTSSRTDLRILVSTGDVFVSNQQLWQEESTAAPKVSVLAVQR